MPLLAKAFAIAVVAATVALTLVACGDNDNDDDPTADDPVSATPGPPTADTSSALFDARRDLAARLQVDTRDVLLLHIQHAGFDGCLGLIREDEPCTEQFIGGYIAFFAADDSDYRYHFGGSEFLAVDFLEGEPDDGMPVPPEMRVDVSSLLAAYALHDAALRQGEAAEGYIITAIVPATFPDGCIGFSRPDTACDDAITPGAIILIATPGGETLTYHISLSGVLVATNFEEGQVTVEPDTAIVATQHAMRADLAARTGGNVAEVTMVAYRNVTWPDGCLGVSRPGEVCTQALVEGFLAILTGESGIEYRYHGAGSDFIAATFESGATIGDPLPPEE